jgi:hypothetical protein
MDPLTIMALGSTALSAIGKLGGGFASSDLATVQQNVANQNTQLLVQRARLEATGGPELAYSAGGLEASRKVADINRTLGTATSRFAAVNLDPTYGSPLVAQGFSASQGRADLDLIAARARMQAAGALMTSAGTMAQAASSQGQATGLGMKSSQDIFAGIFGAGTTALQGVGNAFRPGVGTPAGGPMNITPGGY